jgi:serine/threonine-protein kinase RsbW
VSFRCPFHKRLFCREILSDQTEVDSLCLEIRNLLESTGLSAEVFPVELLLRESLNNAIIHGNCCNCEKKIQTEVRIGRKWVVLSVADEGPGFDHKNARKSMPGPDDIHGRGLAIYDIYAHRVAFNSTGNQVRLWRAVRGDERP